MESNILLKPFAGLLIAATAAGSAFAQSSPDSGTALAAPVSAAAPLAASDQAFFKKAAIGGMTEIEAGKLAAAQGSSAEVKAYGQKMIDDHSKADAQLRSLAASKGVMLPAAPDAAHQAMLDSLRSKQGAAFDQAFVAGMKKGHAEAIQTFTAASQSRDGDVAQFASNRLPTLQEHAGAIPDARPAARAVVSMRSDAAP